MSKRGTKPRPGDDIGHMLPTLARAAASKVRPRKEPMSWSEATAAAPWDSATMPPAWEEPTRRAFAARLVERGIAKPAAKRGTTSGPSGTTDLVQAKLYLSAEEHAAQKELANAAGLSWSTWARRKLAT